MADDAGTNPQYETLLLLDDLETLLEELEEQGITGTPPGEQIPPALRDRMDHAGVRDVQQLRDKIMRLHAQVDEDDRDLTISDS